MRFLLFNIAVIAALAYLAGGRELLSGQIPLFAARTNAEEGPAVPAPKPVAAPALPRWQPDPVGDARQAVPLPPPARETRSAVPLPPPGAEGVARPLAVVNVPQRPRPEPIDPQPDSVAEAAASELSAEERRRALFDLSREMELLAVQAARPSRGPE